MKHLQNSAKTITVFDDEKTFGTIDETDARPELLTSSVNLIIPNDDAAPSDETDGYDDHLIPLIDDEDDELEVGEGHFATALSFIDGITQSMNSDAGEAKSPLLLAAFRSRFLG